MILKGGSDCVFARWIRAVHDKPKTTPEGFEPSRAEPTGLAGRRLNHSAKVSS